jgi:hypothetical protein
MTMIDRGTGLLNIERSPPMRTDAADLCDLAETGCNVVTARCVN